MANRSDFATHLEQRLRALDIEIATLEGARDRLAGLLDEFDERIDAQKQHRANLVQIGREKEAENVV